MVSNNNNDNDNNDNNNNDDNNNDNNNNDNIVNKKKRTCQIEDLAILADHRVKLKESEKRNKFLNLTRELKELWNMKVTVIPIVSGTLGTVTKGLVKRLEDLEILGRVETIQITALLRLARVLKRVLKT